MLKYKKGFSKEVIKKCLLQGKSNQEIANELNLEVKTIKFHLTDLFKESGVKSRLEYVTLHLNKECTDRLAALERENEALRAANEQTSKEFDKLRAEYGRAWLTIKNSNLKVVDTLPIGFTK